MVSAAVTKAKPYTVTYQIRGRRVLVGRRAGGRRGLRLPARTAHQPARRARRGRLPADHRHQRPRRRQDRRGRVLQALPGLAARCSPTCCPRTCSRTRRAAGPARCRTTSRPPRARSTVKTLDNDRGEVVLERNDRYWGEPATLDRIVLRRAEQDGAGRRARRRATTRWRWCAPTRSAPSCSATSRPRSPATTVPRPSVVDDRVPAARSQPARRPAGPPGADRAARPRPADHRRHRQRAGGHAAGRRAGARADRARLHRRPCRRDVTLQPGRRADAADRRRLHADQRRLGHATAGRCELVIGAPRNGRPTCGSPTTCSASSPRAGSRPRSVSCPAPELLPAALLDRPDSAGRRRHRGGPARDRRRPGHHARQRLRLRAPARPGWRRPTRPATATRACSRPWTRPSPAHCP